MESILKDFNIKNNEIIILYNNLKLQGNIQLQIFYQNSEDLKKSIIDYIYKIFKKFIYLPLNKKKTISRYINYLNNKFISRKVSEHDSLKYKLTNNKIVTKLFFLSHLILFQFQISLQKSVMKNNLIYQIIKYLYNLVKSISTLTSKLYLDKIINIDEFEIIIKLLIIF